MPQPGDDPYVAPASPLPARAPAPDRRGALHAFMMSIVVFWFVGFASCVTMRGTAVMIAWIACQSIGMGASLVCAYRAFRAGAVVLGIFAVLHLLLQGFVSLVTDSFMFAHR